MLSGLSAGIELRATVVDDAAAELAAEVQNRGWIAFGARGDSGDWDLFLARPDGSSLRPLTRTPTLNEFAPQFSRDGKQLLYRQIPSHEKIDNNRSGEQGSLVVARSDGTAKRVMGKSGDFPWASWSPDGTQIACLSIHGIVFVDLESARVVRTLPRKGFFQQTTWSPDGQWICGVANSFGTGWSIARLNVTSGQVQAVNTVDCCTPDWFPDSHGVVFSWRPPGQAGNNGYGWTQLWQADVDGHTRTLIYGEDGRHVYGGQVSPDGQYVLFTGNMREDGDPGNAGAPMGLMRLRDAPIIGGPSPELRAKHPLAKSGPVLTLPPGWEPVWTAAKLSPAADSEDVTRRPLATPRDSTAASSMALELHRSGWLIYSAQTDRGDWDLFAMRPDGTERYPVTETPEWNEAGARFSPDGKRLLYYRMPKAVEVDNNTYGTFELIIARADGSEPTTYGRDYAWASWGPNSQEIYCLSPKGIQVVDLSNGKLLRQFPRRGIVQQLICSPDGRRFVGTANGLGPYWNIGCIDSQAGGILALSETNRYNCTPDWMPDSQRVVYARGIVPQQEGRAELWVATADGQERHCVYAEAGRHIYGACASPDGRYLLFTRSKEDLGKVGAIEMAIIRCPTKDAVTVASSLDGGALRDRLDLGRGWEPHWTMAEIGRTRQPSVP